MYKLVALFCGLMFIASCASSDADNEEERIEVGREVTINVTAPIIVPKNAEARWGVVDSDGDPPAVYNSDEVYFVVNNALGGYNFLKLDMVSNGTEITISMQIKLTAGSPTNRLDISNSKGEALSLDLTQNEERTFFFSSKGVESVSMAADGGTSTPGGKIVYKPYGDTLYRTANKIIKSLYPGVLTIDGAVITGGMDMSTLKLTCEMERCTGVFSAKLIIVDDANNVRETGDYFNTAMGSNYKDWNVRAFISGFPLYYSLTNNATMAGSNTGIVNLCDNWAALSAGTAATLSVSGQTTTFMGCGMYDASHPYIYHGDLEGKELCFSISSPEGVVKTLMIDLSVLLNANVNLTGTAIVFLSDLKANFASGRSRNTDEVLDIPYRFFVE